MCTSINHIQILGTVPNKQIERMKMIWLIFVDIINYFMRILVELFD